MLQFFYQTRNILGLVLVISPVLGCLFIDQNFGSTMICLAAAAAALPVLTAAFRLLRFRRWLLLCGAACCGGALLAEQSRAAEQAGVLTPASAAAAALIGIGACGLLVILPPNLAMGWFRRSKTRMLGAVWSSSIAAGILWRFLLTSSTYPFEICLSAAALSILCGSIFFLQRPPQFPDQPENPLLSGGSRSFGKPAAFTAAIASSLGLAVSLLLRQQAAAADEAGFSAPFLLFAAAAAVFPLLSSLFIERKGIFSGCVLLIFLCEASIFCLGSLTDQAAYRLLGTLAVAGAASSLPVVIPVLVGYLYGPANYLRSFGCISFFLPVGAVASAPVMYMAERGVLAPEETVILMLILLVLSFFCIFSAWKHRFVILKNKIL